MTRKDTETVANWPVPTSSKDVERYLGLVNYHRSFVKNFAEQAQPLYNLTGKNQFKWGDKERASFEALKKALTETPVLALPNNKDPFILDCDASDKAIGAELLQVQDGVEKVIAYSSFTLTPEQKNCCTTRKELLSIVRFTRQFRHYLLGKVFTVRTDHSSLTWLLRFKEPQGQLARWIEELSQYNMVVKHRPGVKHGNADALSRIPDTLVPCSAYIAGIKPADLPCGGCHYCKRAHNQWDQFTKQVDDAVKLSMQEGQTTVRKNSNVHLGATVEMNKSTPEEVAMVKDTVSSKYNNAEFNSKPEFKQPWDPERCTGLLDGTSDRESTSLLDSTKNSEETSLLDSILTVDLMGLGGSESHFDIVTIGDELQTEQAKDKNLRIIIDWLKRQKEPDEGILFLSSPEAKYYWLNKEVFLFIDGVLFKKNPDAEDLQLVVPESLKEQALIWHHDIPSSGHQGVARTKAKLKEKFFWVRLSKDVEAYVLSCNVCNRNKKTKRYGRVPLTEFQAGAPMERVHIDFMGPLPKTTHGNEHCLMMVDQFTKWVECVPQPSQRAEVTAKAAIDEFFSRFGFPLQIHTDQGRNFDGKLRPCVKHYTFIKPGQRRTDRLRMDKSKGLTVR
ncbi:uncharacterized protein LOC123530833 [Mercenaria mercenaria]|uniref:uncharacterized protein LOC123530833 n=1 Tax=Mercenaria mercenaria TaxID=6596 RepID=UPI00234F909D|nr:uncharacterized protein LOC123530833 [Mercenaria mercenaria]